MKKVAIITYDLDWLFAGGAKSGGASVVNTNLINLLIKNDDIQLTVFCAFSTLATDKIIIKKISVENGLDSYINEIENQIKAENYDIVLTLSLEYMNHNPIFQSQSFRHRANIESFPINIIKQILGKKKIKRQDNLFKNLRNNNKYFAVSKSVKQDYVNIYGLNTENVFVCYPGVNQVYENLGKYIYNDCITFGCVANNSVNKGGLLFITGLFTLKLMGLKNYKAEIISSKFKKNNLITTFVKILGLSKNIEFLEQQSDMSNFYNNIDCLVLPSKNEAFGLVVLEAMAYGKPCIVSDTAGVSEILSYQDSIIFERKSFISFLKALKSAYNLYHTEGFKLLSQNAFEISKKYSWENFANNILDKF